MAAPKNPKPYAKIAGTLVMLGMSVFMLERFGLDWMRGPGHSGGHIDGTLLSVLVAAPMILIAAGCIVFVVGAMMRPRATSAPFTSLRTHPQTGASHGHREVPLDEEAQK